MSLPSQESSESELLQRAARGDKDAFGQLYEMYLDEIYRYIFYRVADHIEAEDLTEITFIKAWKALPGQKQNREIRNFRAWVYRIAHNLVVDRHREKRETIPIEQVTISTSTDMDPEEIIQQNELRTQISKFIFQLEDTMRQVIVHRFINQLSHAETAQIMGLKDNHVRILQYRALKKLRVLMLKDGK
ncbi:MAG: sigma-70 family RNA polymerase sigma factor [Anaerolineaceae bacterium]|nr:sigma-70 family RNA polymerase sigma factor [Anaerolineaceae bacterium]